MQTQTNDWWPVIREILVADWGFDSKHLEPTTPLFSDTIAPWMDWVDLLQAIAEHTHRELPQDDQLDDLTCGNDLVALLQAY
jgi:hypothetical protein